MNLHGYVDIVQEIINKGVNVNVKDDNSFFFFFFFFFAFSMRRQPYGVILYYAWQSISSSLFLLHISLIV
jgi:hypothetical protein